jgi:hypothetical protein
MKIIKVAAVVLLLCTVIYAQEKPATEDLGLGAFANERGPILLAVDAALVDFQLNSPYVMFVFYLASKNPSKDIVVSRDTITMVYQGQDYKMPTVKELRSNYKGEIHDIDFYRHLGKEGIIASWMRFYNFPQRADFFPALTMGGTLAVDEGSMYSFTGFRTKVYFKNPGFKKGDRVTFKVWDKKDPNIASQIDVVLD